jgi:hypothetical protein
MTSSWGLFGIGCRDAKDLRADLCLKFVGFLFLVVW